MIQFIRSFWGDLDRFNHRDEIIKASKTISLNETVYVWGEENNQFITSLGYNTKLMSVNPTEYGDHFYYDSNQFMIHKLIAVKMGVEDYGEVIFLDWDCKQVKEVDENFYNLIKEQDNKIQMPLYSYPKNYSDLVIGQWIDIPNETRLYVLRQQEYLKKHHYEWNNEFVTPNAGFIYCSSTSIIDELVKLNKELKIMIASEEMSFVEYTKMFCENLEDYIKRFEPLVCNAKYETHFNQKDLNRYITQIVKKDLYFIHE